MKSLYHPILLITSIFLSTAACAALETGAHAASESATAAANEVCATHTREKHAVQTIEEQQISMQREIFAFQSLAEEALSMRARAIRLLKELREKQERKETLSGQDLLRLNAGATAMLDQRAALLKMSEAHECWLDQPVPQEANAAALQSQGIALSLSAALVLYDNYLSAISLYRSDMALRRHLNRADTGFSIREGELNRIAVSFASPSNRYRVRRAIAWFEKHGPLPAQIDDEGYRYVVQLIDQSPSRQIVRRLNPVAFLGKMSEFFATTTFDTLLSIKDDGVFVPSLLFGNAVGLVESRRGKLDERPEVLTRITSSAKAGDILLEKTPFRLTDSFIPGHWGHVAVWIGRENELRELGIWNHPVVSRYHRQIQAGHGVVEALRSGVEMNSLAHFLNIDDIALLRQNTLSPEERAKVIIQALRQVGKAYDFNFDVESTDRIVCSELVYHAYGHINWPTVHHVGRATFSPDNVAIRSIDDGPLEVVMLYHDGAEISEARQSYMEQLLRKTSVAVARAP